MHNKVRIIAGKWRGRKIIFPPESALRPSGDRIRETLFNWISPQLNGACCLDLFAGSGALGFEAASRGAQQVVMIDTNPTVIKQLRITCEQLQAQAVTIKQAKWSDALSQMTKPYDIIFLDPPFGQQLLTLICRDLQQLGLLASNGLVYLEMDVNDKSLTLPTDWYVIKDKQMGNVRILLVSNSNSIID